MFGMLAVEGLKFVGMGIATGIGAMIGSIAAYKAAALIAGGDPFKVEASPKLDAEALATYKGAVEVAASLCNRMKAEDTAANPDPLSAPHTL